jgi:hypothetical protein
MKMKTLTSINKSKKKLIKKAGKKKGETLKKVLRIKKDIISKQPKKVNWIHFLKKIFRIRIIIMFQ